MGLYFITVALQHMLNLNAPVKSLAVAEPVWKVSFIVRSNAFSNDTTFSGVISFSFLFITFRVSRNQWYFCKIANN